MMQAEPEQRKAKEPFRRRATCLGRALQFLILGFIIAWLGLLTTIAPDIVDKLP